MRKDAISEIVQAIAHEFSLSQLPCTFVPDVRNPVGPIFWTAYEEKQRKTPRLIQIYTAELSSGLVRAVDLANVFHEVFSADVHRHFLGTVKQLEQGKMQVKLQFSLTHQWMQHDFRSDFLGVNFCRIKPLRALNQPVVQPQPKLFRLPKLGNQQSALSGSAMQVRLNH